MFNVAVFGVMVLLLLSYSSFGQGQGGDDVAVISIHEGSRLKDLLGNCEWRGSVQLLNVDSVCPEREKQSPGKSDLCLGNVSCMLDLLEINVTIEGVICRASPSTTASLGFPGASRDLPSRFGGGFPQYCNPMQCVSESFDFSYYQIEKEGEGRVIRPRVKPGGRAIQ